MPLRLIVNSAGPVNHRARKSDSLEDVVRRGRNNYSLNVTGTCPSQTPPPPCGGFSMRPLGSPHVAYLLLSKAQFSPLLLCIAFALECWPKPGRAFRVTLALLPFLRSMPPHLLPPYSSYPSLLWNLPAFLDPNSKSTASSLPPLHLPPPGSCQDFQRGCPAVLLSNTNKVS